MLATMQSGITDPVDLEERAMRSQIVAFLEDYCRGMTLGDARDWYVASLAQPDRTGDGVLS
jgi:hypothetical protein